MRDTKIPGNHPLRSTSHPTSSHPTSSHPTSSHPTSSFPPSSFPKSSFPPCRKYNELSRFGLPPESVAYMSALAKTTVHLLTAVLLACPYLCLANTAAGTSASRGRGFCSSCCKCCSRSAPQNSQNRRHGPGQPDSTRGSRTCLCHGAVMIRHAEMPGPDHALATCPAPDAMLLDATQLALRNDFSDKRAACHFPAAESGREVRALIASLLL
jgi:hypothetical protein